MSPTEERKHKLTRVAKQRQQGVVVFEDIYDPHNAAAVLRSCDAFAFQKMCFIFEQEKAFNPQRIGRSSSSSANKWLDFSVYSSTEACFKELKEQGYHIVATALDDRAVSVFSAPMEMPNIALCFGNEHRGLSETAISLADTVIMIPMLGMVQSLNLSVTAAICLYEVSRQRQAIGLEKYLLPDAEQKVLEQDFLAR